MKKSKVLALALAFVMTLSMSYVPVDAAKKVTVKKVTVASSLSGDKKTVVVAKGKSVKLTTTVTVKPSKKANKAVSYSSANTKIATVTGKGEVKGKAVGSTTITVTSKKNTAKKAKIKVKVVSKPVTKVKLDKTSGTLNVGETVSLKAKVTAKKGAVKTIGWKTSNSKVATVSKKGVVTAVGAGTATITAQAIDGSKKKATYKVTVQDPVNLVAMNVLNAQSVTFTLDKRMALDASMVNVKRKKHVSGTYNNLLKINNMTTSDNVNYTVVLDNDSRINVGDFIQVEVPSLTGTVKSLEMEYKNEVCAFTDDEVSVWTVGQFGRRYFDFSDEEGYSSYTISGVPAGLISDIKDNQVRVKGTPTVAGKMDATLTAVDEWGNTLTKTIHFIVGDENTIAGAAVQQYTLLGTKEITTSAWPTFTGGKGDYIYTLQEDPQHIVTNATLNKTNGLYYLDSACVSVKFAVEGTYTVKVRATDSLNTKIFDDVIITFNVKQGKTIGGALKDSENEAMPSGTIILTNKNRATKYGLTKSASFNSETSTYSVIVEPGIYDIEASYGSNDYTLSKKYLYAQVLDESKTGYDIQLEDIHKVVLTSNDPDVDLEDKQWIYNNEYVGSSSVIYLKNGTYSLEANNIGATGDDWFNGIKYITGSFTVNGTRTSVAVTKAGLSPYAAKNTTDQAFVNNSCYLSNSKYHAYYFIPQESGNYYFSSDYYSINFYDMNGNKVEKKDNTYYTLTAGTKYIVGTGSNVFSDAYFTIYKYTPYYE